MKCPRCEKNMLKANHHVFCSHCGYLDNGKQIQVMKKNKLVI